MCKKGFPKLGQTQTENDWRQGEERVDRCSSSEKKQLSDQLMNYYEGKCTEKSTSTHFQLCTRAAVWLEIIVIRIYIYNFLLASFAVLFKQHLWQ